jgi:copper transport protein
VAVSQALGGHSSLGSAGEAPFRVVALAVHFLAAGAWVGGLVVLAAVTLPRVRGSDAERSIALAMLRRFWLVALPSLAALAVTGLYLAGQLVATVDALLLTQYGAVLIAKTALVAGVALLGLTNSLLLHEPARARIAGVVPLVARLLPATAGFRRTIVLEAAGGILVVGAAALLGASAPARGPGLEPAGPAARIPGAVASQVADLALEVSVRPNHPGQNFVNVAVYDTRRPAPAPIERVMVRLVPPAGSPAAPAAARPTAKGQYELADGSIAGPGDYRIAVTVVRRGLPDVVYETPWTVTPTPVRVIVSDQPLAAVATPAAALAGLGLLLVLAFVAVRRVSGPLRPRPIAAPIAVAAEPEGT